jgi:hypothetical protein
VLLLPLQHPQASAIAEGRNAFAASSAAAFASSGRKLSTFSE